MPSLTQNLKTTLDNLGLTKRTSGPESQDPVDAAAHEFEIAAFGKSYFEKRYDQSKKNLLAVLGIAGQEKIEQAKRENARTKATANVQLADAAHHIVTASIKNGASYLDSEGLKACLLEMFPDNMPQVLQAFERCTKQRASTITYSVTNRE